MGDDERREFLKMPIGELLVLANTDETCDCSYDCDCHCGCEICPSGVEISPAEARAFLLEMHPHIEKVICK